MKMNLRNMVTMSMSLLATVSSCVHAGTLDSNQTEIYEYANSVVDSVDFAANQRYFNLIITEFNGTTIGFVTNVTNINILDVDYSFLLQQVNQEMQKRGKGCLNARYRISTGGCTDCGKSLGYSSAHNCNGKGYSCINTCTEKNGHVCYEEWCGSKRAAQKEGFESGCCFNNTFMSERVNAMWTGLGCCEACRPRMSSLQDGFFKAFFLKREMRT